MGWHGPRGSCGCCLSAECICSYLTAFGVEKDDDEWVVDFGAGGWTNVDLGYLCSDDWPSVHKFSCCDLVAGEFSLTYCSTSIFDDCDLYYESDWNNDTLLNNCSVGDENWNWTYCQWRYPQTVLCDRGPNYIEGRNCYQYVSICLMIRYNGSNEWRFELSVWTWMDYRGAAGKVDYSYARYASAASSEPLCDALMNGDDKVELTKVNEFHSSVYPWLRLCAGTLPEIIEIWRAIAA